MLRPTSGRMAVCLRGQGRGHGNFRLERQGNRLLEHLTPLPYLTSLLRLC
jgi:hypothetical protein